MSKGPETETQAQQMCGTETSVGMEAVSAAMQDLRSDGTKEPNGS